MKVLLTGASGFVGSHILESLLEHKLPTAVLLRNSSPRHFLRDELRRAEVRSGSIDNLSSLFKAAEGVTHVVHCAGRTKALKVSEFYETNQAGTHNVVDAVNSQANRIERFLHISSLAVAGPATADHPAREDSAPSPVSDYGKSKLAAELEVRAHCRVPFTIVRPPAVYGPRDSGFFPMFKAVRNHVLPRPKAAQALSVVYAKDLAEAVVACLNSPVAAGKTYFAASPQIVTGRKMAEEIAHQMKRWTVPLPLPRLLLWVVCLLQDLLSRISGRAALMNLQKYAELKAPGWVCSPVKLQHEIGFTCGTTLQEGIGRTLDWYRREHWL